MAGNDTSLAATQAMLHDTGAIARENSQGIKLLLEGASQHQYRLDQHSEHLKVLMETTNQHAEHLQLALEAANQHQDRLGNIDQRLADLAAAIEQLVKGWQHRNGKDS